MLIKLARFTKNYHMKAQLFTMEETPEVITFQEPHEIDCVVDGKPLVAFVTAEINFPIDYAFQVNFSDGFEGIFVEVPNGWWVEGKPWGKKYAEAINKPLKEFLSANIRCITASSVR